MSGLAESLSGWPTEYEAIRCLIADARLWRFPPRFGACRTVWPQLKRSNHLGVESGLETTLRNNPARWEAQEGLADFGICLITVESAGDQMGDGWVASSDKTALAGLALELDTEWSVGVGVWLLAWSGGLLDPGHGSCRGPCLWILPPRMWTCRVAKHTLHVPLGLLISCERGQFCDILSEQARDWLSAAHLPCRPSWLGAKGETPTTRKRTTNKAQNKWYRSSLNDTNESTRSAEAALAMWHQENNTYR